MKTTLALLADVEWNGHMNDGWWVVMVVGMILFLTLVILGIAWLAKDMARSAGQPGATAAEPDPLEILDRRLASGEISPEDYRDRRATLQGGDGS